MVFGCSPVLFYGFIQRAGLDWIGWIGRPLGVTSTLGASTAMAETLPSSLLPSRTATIWHSRWNRKMMRDYKADFWL